MRAAADDQSLFISRECMAPANLEKKSWLGRLSCPAEYWGSIHAISSDFLSRNLPSCEMKWSTRGNLRPLTRINGSVWYFLLYLLCRLQFNVKTTKIMRKQTREIMQFKSCNHLQTTRQWKSVNPVFFHPQFGLSSTLPTPPLPSKHFGHIILTCCTECEKYKVSSKCEA